MLCIILYCLHNCVWEARDYLNNIVFDRLTEKSLVSLGNNISHTPSSARHSIHVLTSDLHRPRPAAAAIILKNTQILMDIHKWLPQFHHHTAVDMTGAKFENIAKNLAKITPPHTTRETINSNWSTFLRTKLQIVFAWVAGTGDSAGKIL